MNINVTTTKVKIEDESLNKGEYNIRECNFTFSEEYEGLVCKALFTVTKTKLTYEQSIVNSKCDIPYEATVNRGKVIVGVIGYEVNGEELVKRYSPEPDELFVLDGSYVEDIENQSTPTPSELEQLEARVSQVEIDAAQVEINTQDISNIKTEQITQNNDISDLQTNKADKSEIPDVSNFITKDVNNLTNYTLTTQTGSQIELSLNSTNFKMTATLKDKNGIVVNTSNEIDLPLESVVVNASYDSSTKEIVLTLQNGNTVRFSVADLISGLISDTDYATDDNAGVLKTGYGIKLTEQGKVQGNTFLYSTYQTISNPNVICKGTLENVITGKGLVSDTNYASSNKGGVIKTSSTNSFGLTSSGYPACVPITYDNYTQKDSYAFISKGTLENVIAGKQLVNETELDVLREENAQLKATLPTTTGTGENITLDKTAEMEFVQPPLPRGNSTQVQYSGKQLFNANAIANTNIVVSDDGKIITMPLSETGRYTNTGIKLKEVCPTLKVGDTAYLYFTRNIGTARNNYIYLSGVNLVWNNGTSQTITEEMLESSFVMYGNDYLNGETTQCILTDFRIVKTQNDTYEPYVGGTASPNPSYSQPITNVTGDVEVLVQNKNLFELLDLVKLSDEYSQSGNGYTFSSKQSMYSTGVELDKPLELPISFSYKIKNGTGRNFRLRFWFDDGTVQAMSAYSSGTGTSEVLITANNITKTGATKITKIGADFAGQYTTFTITDFIINSGTTATTYTPHKEQTFTFPLGTQRMYLGDYLADDGIHHVRKQVTFDGSSDENWSYYSNGGVTNRRFIITISDMKIGTTGNQYLVLCNRFKQGTNDTNDNFLYALANYNNIWVGSTQLENLDVAGFKTWLNTHNVTVEYELATEEITPYTTEQQTAYDEIKQALSYEEQTNISGSSDESNPIFSVEAYQSLKLVLAS